MDYLPITAGLVAALCWGSSDYLATKASREIGQTRTTAYIMLFSTLTLIPALLYTGISAGISASAFFFAFLSSVAAFLGIFFAYRAFRYGNLSITAPVVSAYPAVMIVGAVLILGDVVSKVEIASIAAIILGIVLLSTKFSALKQKSEFLAAGVGSAVVSTIFIGLQGVVAGAYAAIIGYALLSIMWRSASSGLGFLTGCLTKQELGMPLEKQISLPIVAAGVTDAIGVIAFMYALFVRGSTLPIVAALSGFAGGVTVIWALVLLKERPERNQWIGILLAISGVVALSYFS